MENTLVSVLSNRPDDCEILVPHAASYDDPYELAEEVDFLKMKAGCTKSKLIAHAIGTSDGDYVHLLSPGCEVEEGWCEGALRQFQTETIGSVAPAIAHDAAEETATVGLARGCLGRRRCLRGRLALRNRKLLAAVVGPTSAAGFYRRSALDQVGGWPARMGEYFADLDVALSLSEAGYETALDPSTVIIRSASAGTSNGAFGKSRDQERVFWRHQGGIVATVMHPTVAIVQCLLAGGPVAMFMSAAGKLASIADISAGRRHQRMLRAVAETRLEVGNNSNDRHADEPLLRRAA